MKCKECRDFKQCLYEANRLEQIFDPEYEFADCFAPISNADHIRSMSDEEMADFFWGFDYKDYSLEDGVALTKRQLLKWFKMPYKEKKE